MPAAWSKELVSNFLAQPLNLNRKLYLNSEL
ncbi:MAG: hypothetical protein ACJAQ4_001948 [Cryomorphaceae bacterium]|jgi:hypothetical protein